MTRKHFFLLIHLILCAASPLGAEPWKISPITSEIAARIVGKSWVPESPVPLDDLRYVTPLYIDFDDEIQEGEIVVHKDVAEDVVAIFKELLDVGYPIERMQLIDDYDADDGASIDANNTSALCCRELSGTSGMWSGHSFGTAIDINPGYNPYIDGKRICPDRAVPYVDRTIDHPALITEDSACYIAFTRNGFKWFGLKSSHKSFHTFDYDYHHFEKDIDISQDQK